jgi:hypothetical protein
LRVNAVKRIDSIIRHVEKSHDTQANSKKPKDRTVPMDVDPAKKKAMAEA